jgi:hypothetical protein
VKVHKVIPRLTALRAVGTALRAVGKNRNNDPKT